MDIFTANMIFYDSQVEKACVYLGYVEIENNIFLKKIGASWLTIRKNKEKEKEYIIAQYYRANNKPENILCYNFESISDDLSFDKIIRQIQTFEVYIKPLNTPSM